VDQEVVEGDGLDQRTDQDVGRVTDQGCGTADIREHNLREQEGVGLDIELFRDQQGHRCDQQDGGHVVEQGRKDRRDQRKHDQDAPRAGFHLLRRPNRQILEDTAATRDRHDHHHAAQQAEGVPVDGVDRRVLIEHPEQDHQATTKQSNHGAVVFLRHDDGIGSHEHDRGHPQGVHPEDYMGLAVCSGSPGSMLEHAEEQIHGLLSV